MCKKLQTKNGDLQDRQLIPVTPSDSDYTKFNAIHTKTCLSVTSLHVHK